MSPTRTTAVVGSLLNERQYQAFFDSLTTPLIVLDPEGHLLQANHAALDSLGLRDETVLDLPLWEMTWCRDCPEAQSEVRRAVELAAGGASFHGEITYQDADCAPVTAKLVLPRMDSKPSNVGPSTRERSICS